MIDKNKLMLIRQLSKRDIAKRYKGSAFGILWSLLTPIMMISVYGFVFTFVFEARFGSQGDANSDPVKGEFALLLFSGIIIHGFVADILARSPNLIVENTNFVKKVIFPLEIIPVTLIVSSFFQLLINTLVMMVAVFFIYGSIKITILWLPFIMLPLLLLMLGISWFLSAIGVFLRDIGQITSVLSTIILFVSPVFYDIELLPEGVQKFIYLNPITVIVQQLREVVIYGNLPNILDISIYYGVSIAIFVLGILFFQKVRKAFADVL